MKNNDLKVVLVDDEVKRDDAFSVRAEVFVGEQNINPDIERDHLDGEAIHVVGYLDRKPIAAGRAVIEGGAAKIGRMAVLKEYRGKGFGAAILDRLEQACADQGIWVVRLSAQQHAALFYARAGYKVVGIPYHEVGIVHLHMKKRLR